MSKFNKQNIVGRILASPLVFGIPLIAHNLFVLKRFYHFLKFGGEYINHETDERKTIQDIYNLLKQQHESNDSNTTLCR